MKFLTIIAVLAISFSSPAFAAKKAGKAKGKKRAESGLMLKKLDADGNHKIEGAEVTALKEAFAKLPSDSKVRQRADRNGNGELETKEIARINKALAQHDGKAPGKKAKKGKKGKKNKTA